MAQARYMADFMHELRTSLMIIALISRNLEGMAHDPLMLKELQEELGCMHEMIDATSILTQFNGLGPPQHEPVDLALLARQEVERLSLLAKEKRQNLRCTGPKQLIVQGDNELLRWMIRNLVHNAIKYTHEGGQILCEWASVRRVSLGSEWPGSNYLPEDQACWATLCVTDTGVGISQEELPYIFDRSYRGKSSMQVAGAGLGLAIVRELLNAHSGHIGVDSASGEGSRFVVYLPVAK